MSPLGCIAPSGLSRRDGAPPASARNKSENHDVQRETQPSCLFARILREAMLQRATDMGPGPVIPRLANSDEPVSALARKSVEHRVIGGADGPLQIGLFRSAWISSREASRGYDQIVAQDERATRCRSSKWWRTCGKRDSPTDSSASRRALTRPRVARESIGSSRNPRASMNITGSSSWSRPARTSAPRKPNGPIFSFSTPTTASSASLSTRSDSILAFMPQPSRQESWAK